MLSGETVPELDIVGCRGNGAAIGRPCHGLHRSGESAIDKNGTFLWLTSALEKSHRPDLYRMILPPRGDALAIGRPGDRIHLVCVLEVGEDTASSGSLPDLDGLIKTCRGNIPAIGRPGDRAYTAGMPTV